MAAELGKLGYNREKLDHFLGWTQDSSIPVHYLNTNNFTAEGSIADTLAKL